MKLDPFYPIVDSSAWIARLVPLGVKLVQLRIKEQSEEDLRAEIKASRQICKAHGCQLIVNDHWRLALSEKCDFVHLGQEDLATADVDAIRGAGLRLGVSTHDGEELERALSVDPAYVALGPVFETVSKDLKWQPQGLDKIGNWKQRIGDRPLVAIGGITAESAVRVLEAGADCVAVISDVIRATDADARAKDWLERTGKWR